MLFFLSTRALRQGDPMSPSLFIVLADLLSRILARSEVERLCRLNIARTSPKITHLMYTDDLVIYCKENKEEVKEVCECLNQYCLCTSQSINWDKFSVHFSSNMRTRDKNRLCSMLNMKECSHSSTYLGNRWCNFKSRNNAYKHLIGMLDSQLSGWTQMHLSIARMSVLIKSVAIAIPSYTM